MAKMITLNSSDGEMFEVEEKVGMQFETIKNMIEDDCAGSVIPLPNVTGKILSKVIEYCSKHAESEAASDSDKEELKKWDAEYVNVDKETLFEIILAANYLNIKGLMDLTCQTAANIIKDKTPEEVREYFQIENDFTPEEEQELRNEHPWVFEDLATN